MTAEATEAQVAAAMEALGCARVDRTEHEPEAICAGPDHALVGGERPGELVIQFWTDRGCPVAAFVADAVVAAGPDPATIAADAQVWKERFIAAYHFGPRGGEDAPHQALIMEGKGARCRCGHWPYDFDHLATVMGERLFESAREAR